MAPDRWRQVSRVYHEALAQDAGHRPAFLQDACAGDPALRHEVEQLLAQAASAGGRPSVGPHVTASEIGERALGDPGDSLVGRRVGGYHISKRIGAGGMGEVYRARDPKLGRDVAIKILPTIFTTDPERLARFEREARVLAAAQSSRTLARFTGSKSRDGVRALVLELVEGRDAR